jgi:hypothetical protein
MHFTNTVINWSRHNRNCKGNKKAMNMKQRMRSWLSAKIPSKQRAEIDKFADENEISMGEAVRTLIAAGLEAKRC